MFKLFVIFHLIQVIFSYFLLNKLFEKTKINILFLAFILAISGALTFNYAYIDSFVLFILLFYLSIMNDKRQSINQILLTISSSFLLQVIVYQATSKLMDFILLTIDNLVLQDILIVLHCVLTLGLIATTILLINKFLSPFVKIITSYPYSGYLLSFVCLIYQSYHLLRYINNYEIEFRAQLLGVIFILFLILFIIVSVTVVTSLSQHQKLILETELREMEYLATEKYTQELDKQYRDIRKFRHDYINILASLEGYIEINDMEQLSHYYSSYIKPTKQHFEKNIFRLNDIQQINSEPIKSILMTKLVLAQEKHLSAQIEVQKEVTFSPKVNLVILVRILGILLDNAIEELESLTTGELNVALYSIDNDTHIIIENTARSEIEPVYQLKKEGFSTKGHNRGLGLSNVDELIREEPAILLETICKNQKFTQKITITGGY